LKISNESLKDDVKDILAGVDDLIESQKIEEAEYNRKSFEIKKHKLDSQYRMMEQQKEMSKRARNADFNFDVEKYVNETVDHNTQYLDSAREESMNFINDSFDGIVPFMPNQVILIGARTGKGKSTSTANIAWKCLLDNKRVLILSNEERRADVYNRVTALIKDKSYSDHRNMTPEDRDMYNEHIKILANKGMIVIDDEHTKSTGGMSVLETMCGYLENATDEGNFDVILIDYAQKVNQSSEMADAPTWQVQEKFYYYIENVSKKKKCPPIVLMGQLKPDSKEGLAYEDRFEGRKTITKPATCIMEARPNYEARATDFITHKTRWSEHNGATITVGFSKGKYVIYDEKFKQEVQMAKAELAQRELLKDVKPGN